MSRNPFRYIITNRRATLQHGFTTGTQTSSLSFGNQGLAARSPEPRHLPVQPHARARAARRHRRARQLHRLDDAEAAGAPRLQHRPGEHRAARQRRRGSRRARAAAVPDLRHVHGHHREHRRGAVQRAAAGAPAPVQGRVRAERGLHAGRLRQQRARQRQQHHRRRPVRPVRHREGSRARSQRRQAPRRDEQHVADSRSAASGSSAAACRSGPTPSSAAGRCRRSSRRAPDRTSRRSSPTAPTRCSRRTPAGRSTASGSSARRGGRTSPATPTSAAAGISSST